MARASLASVIRTMIASKGDRGEVCALLMLYHLQGGNRPVEIMKQPINSAQPVDPEEVADMFRGRADAHAQDLPGLQHYNICAYYTGAKEPFTQQSFKVAGEDDNYGLATEGPNEKGLIQQMMRHDEARTKMDHLHTEAIFTNLLETVRIICDQNKTLMEENADTMNIAKQLIMERATNEFEHSKALKEIDRSTKERAALIRLGPALVNQITGKEVFPQSVADTAIVEDIAESITEEQIQGLTKILNPQQLGLLFSRFEKAMKDKHGNGTSKG